MSRGVRGGMGRKREGRWHLFYAWSPPFVFFLPLTPCVSFGHAFHALSSACDPNIEDWGRVRQWKEVAPSRIEEQSRENAKTTQRKHTNKSQQQIMESIEQWFVAINERKHSHVQMMKYCVVYTVVARIKTLNNKLEAQTKFHFVGYIQLKRLWWMQGWLFWFGFILRIIYTILMSWIKSRPFKVW